MPFLPLPQDSMTCEGMVLIASLLCACIRNVKMPQLRRGAVLLLKYCSLYIDDEDRLQRVLPYVIAMLSDPAAIVRSAALETLCDILPLVRDFPPSDAKNFPEYILPMLSMLPDYPEESARLCYASNISKLALTAYGFLIHSISLSEAGVLNELSPGQKSMALSHEMPGRSQSQKSDAQLGQLRKSIAEVIQELVMGPKQTPNIRRAVLQDIGHLCWFFGQRQNCLCLLLCGPTKRRGITSAIPDSGWRPRGVLVAHLQEHRSAVNEIAISTDQSFFLSASDDSTVKVWDSRKLEDISFRSRLTYSLEGSRALCIAMLQGSTQVIVGASDGMIHMFSVDYISRGLGNVVEKYSGIADVNKKSVGEGAILSLLNYSADDDTGKMILYRTQNCGIHLWDTREHSNAWNTKVIPEEGYMCSLVTSPCGNWFVSGSSRGVLTLWDLRFVIPVNSWQYSVACPIEKMCLHVPLLNSSLSNTVRPLVYVAAGSNEVSLWNAENGSCHQVLGNLLSDYTPVIVIIREMLTSALRILAKIQI